MKAKSAMFAAIYLVCWLGTAGAINADFRASGGKLLQSPRWAARNQAQSLLFAAFPPMWVMAPFLTGFYYSGWTLKRTPDPCTTSYPDIWCE